MKFFLNRVNLNKPSGNPAWLFIGFSAISVLGWLVNSTTPDNRWALVLFFMTLFLTVYSFSYYVTNIVRRSVLAGSGVFGFLLLRLIGLREPLYAVLFFCCLISLELYFQKS